MNFSFEDLTIIGYFGVSEIDTKPRLLNPIYQINGTENVLVDIERKIVCSDLSSLSEELVDCPITLCAPKQARVDGCLYITEGAESLVVYGSCLEALNYFQAFADAHRISGDIQFKAGNKEAALAEYEIVAAVSQDIVDYERMLLCDISDLRRERLNGWIASLKSKG